MKPIIAQAIDGLMSAIPFLLHTEGSGKDYKMSTARILELLIMALAVGIINFYSIQHLKEDFELMFSRQAREVQELKDKQTKFESDFYVPNVPKNR